MKPEYNISGLRIFYLFIFMIVILSCDNRKIFEEYQKFEKQSWHRFNILKFNVPVNDIRIPYQIDLNIRHLPEFRIEELPVNMTLYMPSGEIRTAEHILKFTADNGESLSECLGDYCDISFVLRDDIIFQDTGTIRIEIENKWPKLELPGILEVGLTLKKLN
jgi:gliding motility-associated lipoprotein GldH